MKITKDNEEKKMNNIIWRRNDDEEMMRWTTFYVRSENVRVKFQVKMMQQH